LEHFNFDLKDGRLKIIATDQDLTIMSYLDVLSEEEGQILVPGKKILEIVRALDAKKDFEFSSTEEFDIHMKTAFGKYHMKGIDPLEYLYMPELFESPKPDIEAIKELSAMDQTKTPAAYFNCDDITRLAEKTSFAVSRDEYRPAMTGVYFQFYGDKVNAVATDSFRLSKAVCHASGDSVFPTDLNVIIPVRAIELLKKADTNVALSFIRTQMKITHCRFDIGETVMITRIIDEKFPPYESVLPKGNNILVELPKDDFLSAIRRAAIFANSNSNQIKMIFEENQLFITGEDEESGSNANESIEISYHYEPFQIGFNHKYLQDAISNIDDGGDSGNVLMTFSESNRPSILKPVREDVTNEDLIMLLMPVRI